MADKKQQQQEKIWAGLSKPRIAILHARATKDPNKPDSKAFLDWHSRFYGGLSGGKANKAPTVDKEAQKEREKRSLQTVGATKGLAVGGEHGGAGIAQRSGEVKVYSPDEIAKLNRERGTVPVELSPEQKRLRTIKTAMERIKRKQVSKFDVPTAPVEAHTADDLVRDHLAHFAADRSRSVDEEVEQNSLQIRSGYNEELVKELRSSPFYKKWASVIENNDLPKITSVKRAVTPMVLVQGVAEEVEQLEQEAANWRRVSAMPKGSATGGKDEVNTHLAYLKAVHNHRKKFGYDTKSVRDKIKRINRSGIAEEVEQVDVGEYDYEGDMAKSQLRSIIHNAQRMHDMLEENTNLPEWVQSKITLAEDYISTTANYMQSEMNEEVEQIEEGNPANKAKKKEAIRQLGLRAMRAGNVDRARGYIPQRAGRETLRDATRIAMERELKYNPHYKMQEVVQENMFSLDAQKNQSFKQDALEAGLSLIPGVGQALAIRDFLRAKRSGDKEAMALATASLVPGVKLGKLGVRGIRAAGAAVPRPKTSPKITPRRSPSPGQFPGMPKPGPRRGRPSSPATKPQEEPGKVIPFPAKPGSVPAPKPATVPAPVPAPKPATVPAPVPAPATPPAKVPAKSPANISSKISSVAADAAAAIDAGIQSLTKGNVDVNVGVKPDVKTQSAASANPRSRGGKSGGRGGWRPNFNLMFPGRGRTGVYAKFHQGGEEAYSTTLSPFEVPTSAQFQSYDPTENSSGKLIDEKVAGMGNLVSTRKNKLARLKTKPAAPAVTQENASTDKYVINKINEVRDSVLTNANKIIKGK